MVKVLMKLLALIVVTAMSCTGILLSAPKDEHSYLYALVDKENLLETTHSPRIILVGGSNLAFGIDSQKIHKETGIQVINFGLHAGVGLKYILNEVRPHVKSKDIVLLIPEYENFFDNSVNGEQVLVQLLTSMPGEIEKLDSDQVFSVLKNTPLVLYDTLESEIRWAVKDEVFRDPIYNRDGFNSYGDLTTHLFQKPRPFNGRILANHTRFNRGTIEIINDFAQFVRKQNALIYYMYPPIPEKKYDPYKVDMVHREVKSGLYLPVLGTPNDYVFPENYFFDTMYHLNSRGRSIRTARLINTLNSLKEINFVAVKSGL